MAFSALQKEYDEKKKLEIEKILRPSNSSNIVVSNDEQNVHNKTLLSLLAKTTSSSSSELNPEKGDFLFNPRSSNELHDNFIKASNQYVPNNNSSRPVQSIENKTNNPKLPTQKVESSYTSLRKESTRFSATDLKELNKSAIKRESMQSIGGGNRSTKIVSDCDTDCNLLYELGTDGIFNGPSSNRLKDDFFNIMNEYMKKLKSEMLEVDLRREELLKNVTEADNNATDSKQSKGNWLTNVLKTKKEQPVQIKSEQLNKVYTDCDTRIVELSNIFLNEKIDLIFHHRKEVDELNRRINYLSYQLHRMGENAVEFQVAYVDSVAQVQTDLTSLMVDQMENKLNINKIENFSQTEKYPKSDVGIQVEQNLIEKLTQTESPNFITHSTQSELEYLKLVKMEEKLAKLEQMTDCMTQTILSGEGYSIHTQSELSMGLLNEMEKKFNSPKTENFSQTINSEKINSFTQVEVFADVKSCQTENVQFNSTQTQSEITQSMLSEMEDMHYRFSKRKENYSQTNAPPESKEADTQSSLTYLTLAEMENKFQVFKIENFSQTNDFLKTDSYTQIDTQTNDEFSQTDHVQVLNSTTQSDLTESLVTKMEQKYNVITDENSSQTNEAVKINSQTQCDICTKKESFSQTENSPLSTSGTQSDLTNRAILEIEEKLNKRRTTIERSSQTSVDNDYEISISHGVKSSNTSQFTELSGQTNFKYPHQTIDTKNYSENQSRAICTNDIPTQSSLTYLDIDKLEKTANKTTSSVEIQTHQNSLMRDSYIQTDAKVTTDEYSQTECTSSIRSNDLSRQSSRTKQEPIQTETVVKVNVEVQTESKYLDSPQIENLDRAKVSKQNLNTINRKENPVIENIIKKMLAEPNVPFKNSENPNKTSSHTQTDLIETKNSSTQSRTLHKMPKVESSTENVETDILKNLIDENVTNEVSLDRLIKFAINNPEYNKDLLIKPNLDLEKSIETIRKLRSSNECLKVKNTELNEMVVELKMIISRMYRKINTLNNF